MNIPKVSIIVPIYNVEKYLKKCIDSILNQTLRNIEVILIDDGSPDNCGKIIDEYASRDSRVKAIHQENSGYGKTLNKGIRLSNGEYIGIVESDDWIENDMYEKLYRKAKEQNAEVSRCGFFIYNSLKEEKEKNVIWEEVYDMFNKMPDDVFSPINNRDIFLYHSALWTYIYKRDFLSGIFFNEEARAYQDYPFIFEILAKAKRMVIVKECLHHYRMEIGQESSSMTKSIKSMQMMDMTIFALNRIKQYDCFDVIKKFFYRHSVSANWYFYFNTPDEYKKKYANSLRQFFNETDILYDKSLPKKQKKWLKSIGIKNDNTITGYLRRIFNRNE